jgi:hypothetical protein
MTDKLSGIDHFREGQEWLKAAEHIVHDRRSHETPEQVVDAADAAAAAAIAQAHFAAAGAAAQLVPLYSASHRSAWLEVLDPSSPYVQKEHPAT